MVNWAYSQKVKDHFFKPRNILLKPPKQGDFDATATIGSVICGDVMQVWLKIDKSTEQIINMKWKTFGCASAIASTSVLSEMVIGLRLSEARKIRSSDIVKALGGLPENKIHCSVMGDRALRLAINSFYRGNGQIHKINHEIGKIIDKQLMITDEDIKDLVRQGITSVEDIKQQLKVGSGDNKITQQIQNIINDESY